MNNKNIYYEIQYLLFKFKPHNLLQLLLATLGAIVVSFGDAQAFFLSESSPIPKDWILFKNKNNAKTLALAFIIVPSIGIFLSNQRAIKKEIENISKITERITMPFFENHLNEFQEEICKKFNISNETRLYIMVPIRKSFLKWHLKTVFKTKNSEKKEEYVSLELDEGAIGYACQVSDSKNRYNATYIPCNKSETLPAGYKHFSIQNKDFVRANNQGYLIFPIIHCEFISSFIILDTTNSQDLIIFEDKKLHEEIVKWIGYEPILMTHIWRIKNYGNK